MNLFFHFKNLIKLDFSLSIKKLFAFFKISLEFLKVNIFKASS